MCSERILNGVDEIPNETVELCVDQCCPSENEDCSILNKIQLDATVCSLIYFTAKSLYMFRVSPHPSSGVLKTVTAASGTGHTVKYKD